MTFLLEKAQRDNFLSDPLRGPAWARLRPGGTIPHVGGRRCHVRPSLRFGSVAKLFTGFATSMVGVDPG
ncbi:hypothetical protein CUJ84_pRLN3000438 (plasmid) [Rhizobium leguminosarum]|uniref:Uncharacterized protein n=1 Tax=Rhizobium leguminosarum TaxID=384 RepID=A0A2K9ZH43_RHILE|nr:hypothetical protein CUJ84_pRLN3000438 [Rhizobium leguminosarum]